MTSPTLAGYVSVRDEKHQVHTFGPADTVPAWAVPLITNPKAWAGEPPQAEADSGTVPVPAKSGPKATAKAWSAYALANGFATEPGASRSEIIAALESEKIPTE